MRQLRRFVIRLACAFICLNYFGGAPSSQPAKTHSDKDELITQSGETNGVKLTVKMRRHYKVGEPIMIDFVLENYRDEGIVLNHDETFRDISLDVTTARRERVPYGPLGYQGFPPEFGNNFSLRLEPNKSMTWHYKLNDYFDVSKRNYYRLSVLRTVDGIGSPVRRCGEDEEVDVGPIKFWIGQ